MLCHANRWRGAGSTAPGYCGAAAAAPSAPGVRLLLLTSPLCRAQALREAPWCPSALSWGLLALKGLRNQGILVASPSTIPGACGCPVLESSRESVVSPCAWSSTPLLALGSCCFLTKQVLKTWPRLVEKHLILSTSCSHGVCEGPRAPRDHPGIVMARSPPGAAVCSCGCWLQAACKAGPV